MLINELNRNDATALEKKAADRIEEMEEILQKIKTWCEAYPLTVFPEPNFEKVREALKEKGMTLDSVAASNMRHVLKGIKDIIGGNDFST